MCGFCLVWSQNELQRLTLSLASRLSLISSQLVFLSTPAPRQPRLVSLFPANQKLPHPPTSVT